MTQIKTTPRKAGEAARPRRRVRVRGWTVAKYAFLAVCGVILYRAGAAYALAERGYFAVGGEVFALFLPLFYYIVSTTIRDYIADAKAAFKEENDHEKTC